MEAIIGAIAKKINSTKSDFSGTTHQVVLKDPVSKKNPKLLITGTPDTHSNYMKWNDAYYWIDDMVSNTDGTTWVVGHIDVLATFKPSILNSSGFVLFGPKSEWIRNIDDPRFGPDVIDTGDSWSRRLVNAADVFDGTGCVVLTVNALKGDAAGGTVHYIGTAQTIFQAYSELGGIIKTNFDGKSDMSELFGNFCTYFIGGSFADNIKSIIWLPFKPALVAQYAKASATGTIVVGGLSVSTSGAVYVTGSMFAPCRMVGNAQIDWPTASSEVQFLRSSKYVSLNIVHPGGVINVDTTNIVNEDSVYCVLSFNLLTGDYLLNVECSHGQVLGMATGNLSVNIQNMISGDATGNIVQTGLAFANTAIAGLAVTTSVTSTSKPDKTTSYVRTNAKGEVAGTSTRVTTYSEPEVTTHTTSSNSARMSIPFGQPVRGYAGSVGVTVANLLRTADIDDCFMITLETRAPATLVNSASLYHKYCAEYGYPVSKYMKLSDAEGSYVECGDISVSPIGNYLPDNTDLSAINAFIHNGIYLE